MTPLSPAATSLVLVGGGHAHVTVLKRFGMRPESGLVITLVAKELLAPYSGMLPGLVAGTYDHDDVHIDLPRLAGFAGARIVHGEVTGIDPVARRIAIAGRPPLAYDLLSIDVGITPDLSALPGAAEHGIPVKPISTFWPRWQRLEAAALTPDGPRHVAVVGGGAAGFELVLAAARRLRSGAAAADIDPAAFRFTLVAGTRLLGGLAPGAARLGRRALAEAAVDLVEDDPATAVEPNGIRLASGRFIEAVALLTTRAAAPGWLAGTGLAVDADGYLALRPTLQVVGDDRVFAAGDCATVVGEPRPKAGVFAVRQGPVLAENLRRASKEKPPKRHEAQRRFLTLLSTADGSAIAARGGFAAAGRWAWWWKDRIDRAFMRRFSELPAMADPDAMRCAGCAAKLGPLTLAAALDRLGSDRERDDAAVVDDGGDDLRLETVDFFRAPWPDPYVLGRVAAHHAMGDILAMGGRPTIAQAICVLPHAAPRIAGEDLFQLLAGARSAFDPLGVDLVGGHSGEGAELSVGFALSGRVRRAGLLRKAGLRPGQRLILTRPIGTGILFAAAMRGRARGAALFAALEEMQRPQADAAAVLIDHGAAAMTDVTGFGFAGHLLEMLAAGGVAATVDLAALPVHADAAPLARAGIASSLLPENLALADRLAGNLDPAVLALVFDPQTAGGFLAGLPEAEADGALAGLAARGHRAAIVGTVHPGADGPPLRLEGRIAD